MFRSRKQTPKGSQTRLYVETDDALAAMLVRHQRSASQCGTTENRNGPLVWLINTPDQLRKKHAREKEDEERTLRIVKALPDAFRLRVRGHRKRHCGTRRSRTTSLRKLNFTPNPAYSRSDSHVEQVLEGMQGYLLIDTKTRRIAHIDGTLFREISFGWGLIGHLDKGGHFVVQQADLGLGDGAWGITEMKLNITGKILMFKSLSMMSDEISERLPEDAGQFDVRSGCGDAEDGAGQVGAQQPCPSRKAHPEQGSEAQKTPQ